MITCFWDFYFCFEYSREKTGVQKALKNSHSHQLSEELTHTRASAAAASPALSFLIIPALEEVIIPVLSLRLFFMILSCEFLF